MAFDVASIKPSKGAFVPSNFPLDPSGDYGATNGRLSADETLAEYIEFAYKVWGNEVQSREFSPFAQMGEHRPLHHGSEGGNRQSNEGPDFSWCRLCWPIAVS